MLLVSGKAILGVIPKARADVRQKDQLHFIRTKTAVSLTAHFSWDTMEARRQWNNILIIKRKEL